MGLDPSDVRASLEKLRFIWAFACSVLEQEVTEDRGLQGSSRSSLQYLVASLLEKAKIGYIDQPIDLRHFWCFPTRPSYQD